MNRLLHHRLLGCALLVGILTMMGETWALSQVRQQARRALKVLAEKTAERDNLARQSPALTAANEQSIGQELARDTQVLAALRLTLQGRDPARLAAPPPEKPIDAYFQLAAGEKQARTRAASMQVAIKPDEHFGFSTYASEGPKAEEIPAVFRQRRVTQYLLEALFAARPQGLLGIQREPPGDETRRIQPGAPAGAVPPEPPGVDYFLIDPPLSLRVPGLIQGKGYRLEFTGQTAVLRTFLNTLAAFQLPLVVRGVEVEPLTKEPAGASSTSHGTQVLSNGPALSKFSVEVELIGVDPRAGEPAS